MATILDFGFGPPAPEAIKAAGHSGAICYISRSRPGAGFTAKPIQKSFVDKCLSLGLQIGFVFQYGKKETADWRRGYEGGRADAIEAQRTAESLGFPEAVIYTSIDDDANRSQWDNQCGPYIQGFNSVIGVGRTGVYGHDEVCEWAIQSQLIGRSQDNGRYYAWQTKAWSEGTITPGIALYQRIVDTESSPGPRVGGVTVDVNDIYAGDWGQVGNADMSFAYTQMMGTKE